MNRRIAILSIGFVLAAITMAWAADVSGKWVAQVPFGRDGQTREQTFTFKAEGTKLTGTVSGMQGDSPISDGKITGDEISFTQALSFNGQDIKLIYKGKVSGDEIKFTRSREGSDRPPSEFTAKRAK
jgi:hypothetical protein